MLWYMKANISLSLSHVDKFMDPRSIKFWSQMDFNRIHQVTKEHIFNVERATVGYSI